MFGIAIKMLLGDRAKFVGILLGLTFASFIITQQAGIFFGLMQRTYGFITDTNQADIWVMDDEVEYIDDVKPIKITELYRVRGVEGVQWAVPMYKGVLRARLPSGVFQSCNIIGIDDATLIGGPPTMIEGDIKALRLMDAVIVNQEGATTKLASPSPRGKIPLRVGESFEINDARATVVGICKTRRTFRSEPVIYTTLNRAINYAPLERKVISYILVKADPGLDPEALCRRITDVTGLAALTGSQFSSKTVKYFIENTGILLNFGFAVLLGFIIGTAIAGQTFYNFTLDNLRFFGTFRAMGAQNILLAKMVMCQALIVGLIGWGIGLGAASLFALLTNRTDLSFKLPWELYLVSLGAILLITTVSALLSILKISKLDPAVVFKT